MQTIRITTSQNIDIEYEVATLGDRFLGRIVDMGVIMGVYYVLYIVAIIIIFGSSGAAIQQGGGGIPTFIIAMLIVLGVVYTFYDLICEVYFNGQSLGKYAMKMRVVSLDGARPSISQFLLRWVFRVVDFLIGFGAVALISVAVSEKKQRIGDIVAGTIVIKTIPKAKLEQLFFRPTTDDYVPAFPEVTNLTDNDIGLVHEVISTFRLTGNSDVVYNMSVRLQQHLGITCPRELNDYQFLEKIAEDYNYLTSRTEA